MAKKSSFNLSAAVRDAVADNPEMSGPEIYELLSETQSGINKSSAAYAYSMARKKLGLIGGKRKPKKRRANAKGVTKRVPKPQSDKVSMTSLMAAKQFLQSAGNDLDNAISLLRQYNNLQK